MPIVADLVKETTTTTGTGNLTLAGAVATFRTFNTGVGVGPKFTYRIDGGAEWEIGIGHLSGSTTLVRDVVQASTNSNALVSFSAGTKAVFITVPASLINPPLNTLVVYISPSGNDSTAIVGDPRFPFLTVGAAITGRGSAVVFKLDAGTYAFGSARAILPAGTTWVGAAMGNTIWTFNGTQTLSNVDAFHGACCVQPVAGAGAPVYMQSITMTITAYASVNVGLVGANEATGVTTYPDLYLHQCRMTGFTDVIYGGNATMNIYAFDCYMEGKWDMVYLGPGTSVYLRNCDMVWKPTRDTSGMSTWDSWGQFNGGANTLLSIDGGTLTYNMVAASNTSATGDTYSTWKGFNFNCAGSSKLRLAGGFRHQRTTIEDYVIPFISAVSATPNVELASPGPFEYGSFNMNGSGYAPRLHTLGDSRWLGYCIGDTDLPPNYPARNTYWTFTAATTSQTWKLFQLPPGTMVEAVQVIVDQAASGTTTATIEVGTNSNSTKYMAATSIATTGAKTIAQPMAVEDAGNAYASGTAATIQAVVRTTGGNVSALSFLARVQIQVKIGGNWVPV